MSTLGPRTALQGVAWALVRVFLRGKPLGMERGGRMAFPFKQQDLADALGLSLVHTNKTLGILRKRQLAHWTEDELRISDLQALADLALIETKAPQVRPILWCAMGYVCLRTSLRPRRFCAML
ncbi:MAG: helix-turn-helix domain-containing protein [Ascidiaceihabitans sp.]|uniref:helix-turn-helix domain-containing protein n=2 Tax=Alphaproteobacteria TaxID=28211 RepID=UPI003298D125